MENLIKIIAIFVFIASAISAALWIDTLRVYRKTKKMREKRLTARSNSDDGIFQTVQEVRDDIEARRHYQAS